MSYINTTRKSRLFIGGNEMTDRMISWNASDSSAFNDGFVVTTGEVVLGTDAVSQFSYLKRRFQRGTPVVIEVMDPTTQLYQRHPRGLLFVMGEVFDPSSQTVTLSTGCRLALYSSIDEAEDVLPLSPFFLDESRQTLDNVRSAFAAAGKILYQDNNNILQVVDAFSHSFSNLGASDSVEQTWYSVTDESVLSVSPLQGASPIPDVIKLSYEFNATDDSEPDDPEIITDENTSTYDIKYPGVIFTRVGSGQIPTDTTGDGGGGSSSVCGNSPQSPNSNTPGAGNPGACSGLFTTVEEPAKRRTTRTEIEVKTYGAVGKQISSSIKETYGAAMEINPQYYADKFAYCRFNYATACNPNGSCSTDGLDRVLQQRLVETFTYDTAGTLVERNLEEWRPALAAAQPFDWRAGTIGGVPTSFTEISPGPLFRSKITNATYAVEGSKNIETISVYESSAVKSRAGIGATPQELVGGGTLLIGQPTSYPSLSGTYSNLEVTTLSGNGAGMTVDVSFPETSGQVLEFEVVEANHYNTYPINVSWAGGTGIGFVGSCRYVGVPPGSPRAYRPTIENPGEGYSIGDLLTWTRVDAYGQVNTFVIRVTRAMVPEPSISINNFGAGYALGDQLKVASGTLTNAVGVPVNNGIFFSVVGSPDSAVNGGKSIVGLFINRKPSFLNKGHYVNVPVNVLSGSGGGASVNIEAINTGVVTNAVPYQQTRGVLDGERYVRSLGEYEVPEGGFGNGSGKGLVLELGIGEYEGVGQLNPNVVTVRRIVNSGTGYQDGDVIRITALTLREEYGMSTWRELDENGTGYGLPLDTAISLRVDRGSINVFPSSVGANFEVGDQIEVSSAVLQTIGAQSNSGSNILATVSRVSAEIELGSLRLDAAEGVRTVTVNTSSTKSTLPDAPDTTASPTIATETVETDITIRDFQYTEDGFSGPLEVEESVPVPIILPTRDEVQDAVQNYSAYLKQWYLGDALGLQVGEALREEIVSNWRPMIGFRYVDGTNSQTIAVRADACSWGVSATEAVVSINAIWCGNVVYNP